MEEAQRHEMTGPTGEAAADAVVEDVNTQTPDASALTTQGDDEQAVADAQGSNSQADELEQAIQAFLADMGSGVVSVSRVVNPLLQVWSVARDVDAEVAVPVENLLTVLVGRSLTTSQELAETMTEVRAVLAGTTPLASV